MKRLTDSINLLDSLDDVVELLSFRGISADVGKAALETSKFSSELNKVVDSATGLKAGEQALQGLSKEGKTVGNVFKGLGSTIKSAFVTLATNPLTWLVAAGAIAVALEDAFTVEVIAMGKEALR